MIFFYFAARRSTGSPKSTKILELGANNQCNCAEKVQLSEEAIIEKVVGKRNLTLTVYRLFYFCERRKIPSIDELINSKEHFIQ